MKTTHSTVPVVRHTSEVMPEIGSSDPRDGVVITWADANPNAYKLVTTRKSKSFGLGSCAYIGWAQQSNDPAAVLARLRHLKAEIEGTLLGSIGRPPIFGFRAKFALEHFADKDLKSGFFQQFDGSFDRGCMSLDYTPATRDEVVRQFLAWCFNGACDYGMNDQGGVKIDGELVYAMADLRRIAAVTASQRRPRDNS